MIPCIPTPATDDFRPGGLLSSRAHGRQLRVSIADADGAADSRRSDRTGIGDGAAREQFAGRPDNFPGWRFRCRRRITDSFRCWGTIRRKEGTSFWSLKLDHIWNSKNTSFIRARRFAVAGHRHSSERRKSELRPERRQSHVAATNARPGHHRPAHDCLPRRLFNEAPLPVRAPRPALRLFRFAGRRAIPP